jgi:hypothetical protein
MGLLENGGRELGQWPPLPLKHFRQKWNLLRGENVTTGAEHPGTFFIQEHSWGKGSYAEIEGAIGLFALRAGAA